MRDERTAYSGEIAGQPRPEPALQRAPLAAAALDLGLYEEAEEGLRGALAIATEKLALADASLRMVNRNRGAGTRVLIDQLLAGKRPFHADSPRSTSSRWCCPSTTPTPAAARPARTTRR